jgi:hypothetical protein
MMKCEDATRLASDRLDRSLSMREGLALRLHLLGCDGCNQFTRQMLAIRRISRHYVETDGSGSED